MNAWNNAPFVRILFPFIVGIIVAVFLPYHFLFSIYLACTVTVLVLLLVTVPQLNFSYKSSWVFGLIVNSSLFLLGYQLTISKTENLSLHHFSNYSEKAEYACVRISEPIIVKDKSLKVVAGVLAVKQDKAWHTTKGKVLLYLKNDKKSLKLNYGDELVVKSDFKEVPSPQNPGEFDYKSYLALDNICYQAFIKNNDWMFTGTNSGNPLIAASLNLRNTLLKIISDNGIKDNEFAVGTALLLGYEDELDDELLSGYSKAGVIHILSVSGLHVGIIYIVLNWLLSFFDKVKHGNIIKALLLLLFLWFYAALTGFSPAVLRASTMFSFIVIAQAFNRQTNIYNTLAASAFLLLLINPFLLMSVGFQLSYLAVIGIVAIHPKLYSTIQTDNLLLDKVWVIVSVSISAQLAAFPLAIYYFHQFPNCFLLANVIAIPLSTLIVYLGICLFIVAKVPVLSAFIAVVFNYCLWLLNQFIIKIEQLPYVCFDGIIISIFQTVVIYGLLITLYFYFTKARFRYLFAAFSLIILLFAIHIVNVQQHIAQKKLIVYNIPKTGAVDFISGKTNILLTDSAFIKNEKARMFHVKNNWDNLGVIDTKIITGDVQTSELFIKGDYIKFYDKRIVHLSAKNNRSTSPVLNRLNINYLILSNNCNQKIKDVLKLYDPQLIVFDSSNSVYQLQKWKDECIKAHQPYYSVADSGALVLEL